VSFIVVCTTKAILIGGRTMKIFKISKFIMKKVVHHLPPKYTFRRQMNGLIFKNVLYSSFNILVFRTGENISSRPPNVSRFYRLN